MAGVQGGGAWFVPQKRVLLCVEKTCLLSPGFPGSHSSLRGFLPSCFVELPWSLEHSVSISSTSVLQMVLDTRMLLPYLVPDEFCLFRIDFSQGGWKASYLTKGVCFKYVCIYAHLKTQSSNFIHKEQLLGIVAILLFLCDPWTIDLSWILGLENFPQSHLLFSRDLKHKAFKYFFFPG